MKYVKGPLMIAGIITAVGAAGAIGATVVNAATSSNGGDRDSSLVTALAQKFNLKESDIQSVLDEDRAERDTEREQETKDEVAQLVKDGKLTQDQADKINAKRTELKAEREANKTANQSLSNGERKAKMDEHKAAIDTWLKDSGVDSKYEYLLMGKHGRGGPDGGPRHEDKSNN